MVSSEQVYSSFTSIPAKTTDKTVSNEKVTARPTTTSNPWPSSAWSTDKIVSSEKVTARPSSTNNPVSAWTTDKMVSSEKITVQPSSTGNPVSAWITWPQSTNKLATKIQCSNYHLKIAFKASEGVDLGMFEISRSRRQLWIHCIEGGKKDWYGGSLLKFSTWSWGICRSGTSETLLIERTSVALKIMRGYVEVFSRNWAATDGRCLLKAGFWRLQNYGTTILSARSILGTYYTFIILIKGGGGVR